MKRALHPKKNSQITSRISQPFI